VKVGLKYDLSALRDVQFVAHEEGLRLGKISDFYVEKKT